MKTNRQLLIVLIIGIIWIALSYPSTSRAESLILGGFSYHFNPSDEVTESFHNLYGIETHNFHFLQYKNSYGNQVSAVGYEILLTSNETVSLSVIPAVNYGYGSCTGGKQRIDPRYCFTVVPVIKFHNFKHIQPSIAILGPAVVFYLTIPLGN